jgi:hypothetical protein
MMNRMKSTKLYHPNKNGWAKKKRNRMLKRRFELNQELSSGDEEAMEANAVMSGRRVARKRRKKK